MSFDDWIKELNVYLLGAQFLQYGEVLDRGHFKQYYDLGYSVEDAFEEDLTAYGDY